MRRYLLLVAFALPCAAFAKDIQINPGATQNDFHFVSQDAVATIEYKALAPAEASGITGFELAAVGSWVPVHHKDNWKNLTGLDVSNLGLVGVRAIKGLPFNIDVGAFYSTVPGYNVSIYGGEVKYAILPGSVVLPAVALRASYNGTHRLDDFKLRATTVDASVSKGFAFITPYLGAGYVWGVASPDTATGLKRENINKSKVFAGARISLGLLHVTPEIEAIGSNVSYNLDFGIHW